tara:strand:+ start:538 stop:1665 length:1128 start_codon:yes stop_codon:yes gene_type:complete
MATPSSGNPISFTDIENEFGQATIRSIGSYVDTWDYGDYEAPLDRGPNGGTSTPTVKSNVKFSDFYSRELNIVTDFYSGSADNRLNAHTIYGQDSDVVGPAGSDYGNGSVSPPSNGGGKRVTISVNKDIGSEGTTDTTAGAAGEQKVALKTGTGWQAGTELFIHVGNNGFISGAGGNGGNGGGSEGTAPFGSNATSALGIQWEGTVVTAINNGKITHGYPGGGGGGGAWAEREERWRGPTRSISGSGGGGGAGIPAGAGGSGSNNGGAGNRNTAGEGGPYASNTGDYSVYGGAGGDGGWSGGGNGGAGYPGNGGWTSGETEDTETASGGSAGQGRGAAIRKTNGSISWTFGTGHVTNNVIGEGKDGSAESPTGVS